MKKSQLKESIKSEIKSVLSEEMTDKERENKLQQAKRGGGKEKPLRKLAATGKKEDSLNEISSTEANAQLMEIVEHQKQILNILKELKKGADLDAAIRIIENEIGKTLTKIKNLKQIKGLQTTFADIREGTWSSGTYNEIGRFIQDVKNLKDKYYDIVGNDDVFDGLDRAEESAREMMINAPENRSDIREEEDDDAKDKKAYKGAAKMGKKKSKRDKVIDAYNEIGGGKEVKEKAKKAKEGDKEALNWLKTNQPKIKAYNDLKK